MQKKEKEVRLIIVIMLRSLGLTGLCRVYCEISIVVLIYF